jgi:hypothetical protein
MKDRKIQAKLQSITGKLSVEDLEDLEEDFEFYDPKVEDLKRSKDDSYSVAEKFKRKGFSHENVDGRSKGDV